nr:MAG: hypothetical protein CM15mP61_00030 [Gammaproteobacteria bacterium]
MEDDRNEIEDHTFNYEVLSEVLKNVLSSEGYKGFGSSMRARSFTYL